MKQSTQASLVRNVEALERGAFLLGGLMLAGKGLRRGGLLGIIQFAIGGVVLARGINEQAEADSVAATPAAGQNLLPERYSHMPMDSEVHSPDFEHGAVELPDATQMGHEAREDRR
ncbi:hypothetical protein [Halopseudomonas sp.]|uniref:hypothetical protein n=1 Tax=Halopseudomonas sp. TaxID=2901191 RepID=UPI0035655F1D